MDIVVVLGFKFTNAAGFALDQSMYCVESAPSQKACSSFSSLNFGIGLGLVLFIAGFLLAVCATG